MSVWFIDAYMRHSTSLSWHIATLKWPLLCRWHQMQTFSALLALSAGNSSVTGEFPSHIPVTRSFDVFFHLRLNKRLTKQSWGWWFDMPSCSLGRHCDDHFELSGGPTHDNRAVIHEVTWRWISDDIFHWRYIASQEEFFSTDQHIYL